MGSNPSRSIRWLEKTSLAIWRKHLNRVSGLGNEAKNSFYIVNADTNKGGAVAMWSKVLQMRDKNENQKIPGSPHVLGNLKNIIGMSVHIHLGSPQEVQLSIFSVENW